MKKQLIFSSFIFVFLLVGTVTAIFYGRGYRFSLFQNGKPEFLGTGLLVVTSKPDGAQVFINDHLSTATNNTINLAPGTYDIKIFKEGYFPWVKRIKIEKEVVSKADAILFPNAPGLQSLTTTGIGAPTVDPSGTRLAYTVASQSARKNGVYVFDMNSRPILTLQSSATQIADDTGDKFSEAVLSWSPDGQQLLATISASPTRNTTYLLETNGINDAPRDVTATLPTVNNTWLAQQAEITKATQNGMKKKLRDIVAKDFNVLSFSPDESKILYIASKSATLPIIISPRLPGVDTTPEDRKIKTGNIYAYDIKEDKNYKLYDGDKKPLVLRWFPDGRHLVAVQDKRVTLLEIDGSNRTTAYAGPFLDGYVFPWPDGTSIVVLTNLGNPDIAANLYQIDLK